MNRPKDRCTWRRAPRPFEIDRWLSIVQTRFDLRRQGDPGVGTWMHDGCESRVGRRLFPRKALGSGAWDTVRMHDGTTE